LHLTSKYWLLLPVTILILISAKYLPEKSSIYYFFSKPSNLKYSEPYKGGIRGWPLTAINGDGIFPYYEADIPLIGLVDTGVYTSNPFLLGSKIRQIVIDENKGCSSEFHGTMVAGLMVSNGNGWSTPEGMIPNANLLSIQIGTDSGTNNQQLASAIVMAVNEGARVINISLGTPKSSPELEESVEYAISKGSVIVAAAGNQNLPYNIYPAAYEDVIAVSSLSANQKLGNNTNCDIKNIAAPGDYLLTTGPSNQSEQSMQWISGSSASAPLVTSLVAVLLSKHQSLNTKQVSQVISQSAKEININGKSIKILDIKAAIKLADTY